MTKKPAATLQLPRTLWHRLAAHARVALPREAAGLLGGNHGRVTTAIPLPNIAPTGRFFADPYAQYQAEQQLKQDGTKLLAIYHSHPAGGTQLSPLDLVFANRRSCLHIVIALDPTRPGRETAVAYTIQAGKPCEVPIEIS